MAHIGGVCFSVLTDGGGTDVSLYFNLRRYTEVRADACAASPLHCCVTAVLAGPSEDVWHFDVPPTPTASTRTVHACATAVPDSSSEHATAATSSRILSIAADEELQLVPGYYHIAAHVADDVGVVGLPPAVGRCSLNRCNPVQNPC